MERFSHLTLSLSLSLSLFLSLSLAQLIVFSLYSTFSLSPHYLFLFAFLPADTFSCTLSPTATILTFLALSFYSNSFIHFLSFIRYFTHFFAIYFLLAFLSLSLSLSLSHSLLYYSLALFQLSQLLCFCRCCYQCSTFSFTKYECNLLDVTKIFIQIQ